ncbi:nitrile hydratase subunit alpha [Limibaculum sp. FT325]|uniref:nitrile hydratase subunit alpha n=1 Tax=Thermohalobaculum sediminis TaxID=2939436 RepID=UPI0020BEB573|nr:nitrile hydratase subunit alpha [Limibaculum sediminis]MCL5776470.1 nitrile hydratase subunit alpha [Limibaculum sediminis]
MPHDHDHDHGHDHGHDHHGLSPSGHPYRPDDDTALSRFQIMEIALREILIEKGITTAAEIMAQVERMDARSPALGARVVARAWVDPAFKARLMVDGSAACRELGIEVDALKLVVVENTAEVHNVVVCTLCSCYPRNLLGLPPDWYKTRAYRSRVVREPRAVLAEFGTRLPGDMRVQVHDSTADMRYLVLPARPAGTEGWTEDRLAALVGRDAMIGVALAGVPEGAPPA